MLNFVKCLACITFRFIITGKFSLLDDEDDDGDEHDKSEG